MINQKLILSAVIGVCFFLANSIEAFACACCAERGTYILSSQLLDTYQLGLLGEMKFGDSSKLFGMPGDFKGFPEDLNKEETFNEDFKFGGSYSGNQWKLNFTDHKNRTGNLTLTKPAKYTTYLVDQHDTEEGDPLLYKEWRFEGTAIKGTGIFQKGITPGTKFFLVFQGKGNMCDNAEDFSHWRVEVSGKTANYKFFGKMGS